MTEPKEQPPGPFSPMGLIALLNEKVFKKNKLEFQETSNIKSLTLQLNQWERLAGLDRSLWEQERERFQSIGNALDTLFSELPLIHVNYTQAVESFRKLGEMARANPQISPSLLEHAEESLSRSKSELQAITSLYDTVSAAHELGLPRLFGPAKKIAHKWEDLADQMQAHFNWHLPKRPKADSYRFIQHVTPLITMERPTEEAVRTHLKRGRPVSNRKPRVKG